MSTKLDSWARSWLIVMRDQPNGYWIINGYSAVRIDPVDDGIRVEPSADNDR